MTEILTQDKWNTIYSRATQAVTVVEAAWVLQQFKHLLPSTGAALDLACGRGANALLLAQQGLATAAWDISDVAVQQLSELAASKNLSLQAQRRDVEILPPQPQTFDVIVVAHYLQRALFAALKQAVRPQGLLYYQTFTQRRPEGFHGPSNPDFLLRENELLQQFSGWKILHYREDDLAGELHAGRRGEASIVVQKPA